MLNNVTRRAFLKGGISVLAVGAAMPTVFTRAAADSLRQGTRSAGLPQANTTLIVVQMAGGNDGINTVIPYTDPLYRKHRPQLAVPEEELLKLDDRVALHPTMTALKGLWDSGKLAVVQGAGYPNPNFSHFESMDIWHSADPDRRLRGGWLTRFVEDVVDTNGHPIFSGLAIGKTLPPALCCPVEPPPTVDTVWDYKLLPDPRFPRDMERQDALARLYDSYAQPQPYAALLDTTADRALVTSQTLQEIDAAYQPAVEYPKTPFGQGLKVLAEAINADIGLRVGYIPTGGYDTHVYQKYDQPFLLKGLSEGLAAFYADLAAHGKDQNVVVMTWSEFGRRVEENANGGTDHGTAGPMFVLGTPVRGGLYGEMPSLSQLADKNLQYTVDFRSVYATMIEQWFGADPTEVLGQRFPTLPLLR